MTAQSDPTSGGKKRIYEAAAGENLYRIEVLAILCGDDMAVIICGGNKYHIGASALAVPRPSLNDPHKISASASVLTVVGHKEDELARRVALFMASTLNCTVTATVGIHLDKASEEDIGVLTENCFKALNMVMKDVII